ncbi:MAG: hypothetical protein RLZZ01_2683 [Actinomycetota bacterium]
MTRQARSILVGVALLGTAACGSSVLEESAVIELAVDADGSGSIGFEFSVADPDAALAELEEAGLTGITEAFDLAYGEEYGTYCAEALYYVGVVLAQELDDPVFDGHDVGWSTAFDGDGCSLQVVYSWAAGELDQEIASLLLCAGCDDPEFVDVVVLEIGDDGSYQIGIDTPPSSEPDPSVPPTTEPVDPYAQLRVDIPGYTDDQYQLVLDRFADSYSVRIVVPTADGESSADMIDGTVHAWMLEQGDDLGQRIDLVVSAAATTVPPTTAPTPSTVPPTFTVPVEQVLPATGGDGARPAIAAALFVLSGVVLIAGTRRRTSA